MSAGVNFSRDPLHRLDQELQWHLIQGCLSQTAQMQHEPILVQLQ